MRGWPTQYNSFVQSFSIGLPDSLEPANRSATSFYRVFNVDFKKGGRLVGHWIFNIKRKDRHRLILNGEQATELDYESMYAHLLYSLAGFNYHDLNHDGDPYLLENFERALGKWGFHIALNSRKTRGFPRALKNRLREDGWSEEALRGFNGAHLLHEILQKHKPVERLLFNQTNGNRCAYLDSMLIQNVLSHYLDWKVPVLPMHDGVITTVSERDRLKGVMEHEAERFLKSVPVVEI